MPRVARASLNAPTEPAPPAPAEPTTAQRLAYVQVTAAVKLGPAPGPERIRDTFESPTFDIATDGNFVYVVERIRATGVRVPDSAPQAYLTVPMTAVVAYRELS